MENRVGVVSTLRIATFNARFLPGTRGLTRRARGLAHRVRDADIDVLALNELFAERARRALGTAFRGSHPHAVSRFGRGGLLRLGSGLAVFSRVPVRPGAHAGRPTFAEYRARTDSDALAGKGVGYVEIPGPRASLHVFLTHLQAGYPRDGEREKRRKRAVRFRQIRQIRDFMVSTLSREQRGTEPVLVLGDLNVDGHRSADRGEWRRMLEVLARAVPTLTDAWEQGAPDPDGGATFPARRPVHRFDYILWSPGTGGLVRLREVGLAAGLQPPSEPGPLVELSDHLGVQADLEWVERVAPKGALSR